MIFSTNKAIVVTGLKHGSSQLFYTAYRCLGIPHKEGHNLEYVKPFNFRRLFNLLELGVRGDRLMEEMNLPTGNKNFNKVNYVTDIASNFGKPLILFIRDPLKAAQSSIIEDLVMFLNLYAGYLAGKSGNVMQLFQSTMSSELLKSHLEGYTYIEDLFFELNQYALDYDKRNSSSIFTHTEYEHLSYINNILSFYSIRNNNNVFDSILLLDIDSKHPTSVLDQLHEDEILLKTYPTLIPHTTTPLVKLLPDFLEKIPSINLIYKNRLFREQAMYSFIMSEYKDKIFTLERYLEISNKYIDNRSDI